MAEFNGFVLTNEGKELLVKAIAGETLTFTKVGFGDGLYEGEKKELKELVNLRNNFSINQMKTLDNKQVILRTIISNKDIEEGYHIKEIGIYGYCNDRKEVLYAYNTAIEADYLPAFNNTNLVELEYVNYIMIDQAEKVAAIIDERTTYLTKEEAREIYVPQTQVAKEKEKGILSLEDVRKISNEGLAQIVEDVEGFRFIIDKEEKILKVFRYDRANGGNIKTVNWVYNEIIAMIKRHNYDLIHNTFISSYYVHQGHHIKASYSVYYDGVFTCYLFEGNEIIDTNFWYFHTGELKTVIV